MSFARATAGWPRVLASLAALFVVLSLFALPACHRAPPALVAVPDPDSPDLEPAVRRALQRARSAFDRIAAGHPGEVELGNAYGELAMTYQAQSLVPAAAAAYANARALSPRDKRWPYLQGHLFNDASRVPEAIGAFEAALAIDGRDGPALFSLGEACLQHGDFDKARDAYLRLQSVADAGPAAEAGLGKVALATHHYQDAVDHLEAALKLVPGASRLRQPLAMAYRGLGDAARAEQNLRLYSQNGVEPGIDDPVAEALDSKVAASRVLVRRGQRFGKAGRFDLAEPAFRAAVEADPSNADAIANLGISLANLGRLDEAQRRLTESLALDDSNALAHLSLAVVLDRQGQDAPAIAQYRAALEHDAGNLQARVYLADAQMRAGSVREAAQNYREALERLHDSSRVALSLAMAEVRGGRWAEARKVLEAGLDQHPDNAELANALARVLCTAPAAPVRDGPRALQMATALFQAKKDPDIGQTFAMAMAETGRFDQAIVLQKETMIVFEHTGGAGRKPLLERNLQRYQRHEPSREGWSADDPLFHPRSPAAQLAKAAAMPTP